MSAECSRCGADLVYGSGGMPQCAYCAARRERDEAVADRVAAEREARLWHEQAAAECRLRITTILNGFEIERRRRAAEDVLRRIEQEGHESGPIWFGEVAAAHLNKYR